MKILGENNSVTLVLRRVCPVESEPADITGAGSARGSPPSRGWSRESSLRRRKKRRRRESVGPVSTNTPAQSGAITITGENQECERTDAIH